MTRKTKDFILLGVNIVLIIALAASVFAFVRKSNDLTNAKTEISHKQTAIEKQLEENKQLEEKLKESEQAKDSLQKAKEGLEKENSQLKKTITELKAKKEKEAAANAVKPAAVPQNPQPSGKICYLTFDDGPSANTLNILKILDRYNAKATFFVIDTAQTKIEYVKQIHAAGHTIGLHSKTHNYSQIYSSVDNYLSDLNAISNKVKDLIGIESKVIRFPGGSSNAVSKKYSEGMMTTLSHKVTEQGYTYFDWNVSSEDASAKVVSTTKIINSVLNGAKGKNSICVLMHDAAAKTTTVDALPAIIEGLIKQGFSLQPLTKDCHGYHHGINN